MRIFYAADHEPFPGNQLWHKNLFLALVDLGHPVVPFDYDLTPHFHHADPAVASHRTFAEQHRPALEAALLQQIEEAHRRERLNVFFSYFYSAFCRPEVIRQIRSMGICTVNWYCNAAHQFHLIEPLAPAYDFCLVPEKSRLADYRRIGAHPVYCQQAANPTIYKPHSLPQEFDVTFAGQKYGDRPDFVHFLVDAGIAVRVWGKGWTGNDRRVGLAGVARTVKRKVLGHALPAELCGPPLSDDELVKLYSRSKISLGFSACGETHATGNRVLQVHLRDFEAPMSGAFYMVEYMEELEEFYSIGDEIVCYTNKQDLADKIRFYLQHDAERERIRQAGHRRALADHTWQKRLAQAFQQMGLTS